MVVCALPGVAGYISGVQYKLFGGTNWVRNVLLTATLFCGPLLVVFSFLNTVAIIYRARCSSPVVSVDQARHCMTLLC